MASTDDERVMLTVEQALGALDLKGGNVHTFMNPGGMLVGTTRTVAEAKRCFEQNGVELAGELAVRMGHGVVSFDGGCRVFFATKPEALVQVTP